MMNTVLRIAWICAGVVCLGVVIWAVAHRIGAKKRWNDWINSSPSELAMAIKAKRMLDWEKRIRRNGL